MKNTLCVKMLYRSFIWYFKRYYIALSGRIFYSVKTSMVH